MKKGWLVGGASILAAAAAGGISYFYALSVPRKSFVSETKTNLMPERVSGKAKELYESALEWYQNSAREDVYVTSFDGLKLHGNWIPAEEDKGLTVIMVHGYRSIGFRDFGPMLPFYHGLGANILMVDDRGHGESEGDYVGYGWHDHYDVEKWISYVIHREGEDAKIFLHGVSMGAATVMMVSGEELPEQVKGIIEDCGYTNIKDQMKWCVNTLYHMPAEPFVTAVSKVTRVKNHYGLEECDSVAALRKAKLPYLFIHGSNDTFVPTKMVYENYDACASPDKKLVLVEGAEHAESYVTNAELYEKEVTEFINTHLV